MARSGYAVVAIDDLPWTRHGAAATWAALTGPLGVTETRVDAARLGSGGHVELAGAPEQLLVVLDGSVEIAGLEAPIAHPGLVRVPAGETARLGTPDGATVLVLSVEADASPEGPPTVVDLEGVDYVVPETSDVATGFLTGPLGCAGMKVNARRLEPGQAVPYHTEGTQEELFVPVAGPASLLVDDGSQPMAVGSVARVAPDVPRSAVNDGEEAALWVMVGAPPTGGPTGWDPGAEILE